MPTYGYSLSIGSMEAREGNPVTLQNIRDRITRIINAADKGDDEAAHSMENTLHKDVLRAIAGGADAPGALAFEALKTTQLDFERYAA